MKVQERDLFFMKEALKLAHIAYKEEEVPVGAVAVYKDKIIAKGYNQVELLSDATAHAEILTITAAMNYLKSKWLYKSTVYVTIEPCVMCAGALMLSRIQRLVFGAFDSKAGAFGSKLDINSLKLNHNIKVKTGILEEECAGILTDFFRNKRKQKSRKADSLLV